MDSARIYEPFNVARTTLKQIRGYTFPPTKCLWEEDVIGDYLNEDNHRETMIKFRDALIFEQEMKKVDLYLRCFIQRWSTRPDWRLKSPLGRMLYFGMYIVPLVARFMDCKIQQQCQEKIGLMYWRNNYKEPMTGTLKLGGISRINEKYLCFIMEKPSIGKKKYWF